ncbi:MAG: glycogen debranching protein GlgX [Acidimicrobiia bacterium]
MTTPIWPGEAFPQGATPDGSGTNFAVFSESAERVELCLFDEAGSETRLVLPESTGFVHHGYVPGVKPGQRYGYRIYGEWDPARGLVSNPQKLLLDPYSKAIEGSIGWSGTVFAYDPNHPERMDHRDSAFDMPRSVVVGSSFDWGDDSPPRHPLFESIIYETHVRGISAVHPGVPAPLRGTYAGMASEPIIAHLVSLGITAVELQPVHHFVTEHSLVERGLTNYWGYSTIGFFAPHGPYSSSGDRGQQVDEFKNLVKTLHAADIEVILDVVYNHTGESGPLGPTLAFRGLDNASYYRLDPVDASRYIDYTGTGNSLNVRHAQVLTLIMDSLRYWVQEMHVDGFRFDLAAALARDLHEVDRLSTFFDLIHQDPVVSQVKLIAEPWDVGDGGYQVGNFPILWSEWNAKFRDGVRDYWRGEEWMLSDFASRFTGSSDLYGFAGRQPHASINFVTAHDGFTLADLVSFNGRHNEANGEGNRDGEGHNRSWNSGVEGESTDPGILRTRRRRARAILTTLMLSQGVPMLLGGDEIGRTQGGNNNAYAQDNDVSWYDWAGADDDMLAYTTELIRIRRGHPVFHRRRWFEGRSARGEGMPDIHWYNTDGSSMSDDDWNRGFAKSFAVYLNGEAIPTTDAKGGRVVDDSFLVLFNAHDQPVRFAMPDDLADLEWEIVLHSAIGLNGPLPVDAPLAGDVEGWSVILLMKHNGKSQ